MLEELLKEVNKLDVQDLSELNRFVVARHNQLRNMEALNSKMSFNVGDSVSWESRKQGMKVTGKIIKINRTKAVVKADNGGVTWTVPFDMLKKE